MIKKTIVDLLKSDTCKKKNEKVSIRKIVKEMEIIPNTISRELKKF
ncbi:hypothetical protein [Spiroplasma endosymbiont of Polydrusus formosus]